MNRNPLLCASVLALLALTGCAYGAMPSVGSSLCNQKGDVGTQFSRLAIEAFADQHGDYAKVDDCPERIFAIDWSESGLFDNQHADLLAQMRTNSSRSGQAINMVVSGSIQVEDRDGHSRVYLGVTQIVEYAIDD